MNIIFQSKNKLNCLFDIFMVIEILHNGTVTATQQVKSKFFNSKQNLVRLPLSINFNGYIKKINRFEVVLKKSFILSE